MFIIIFMVCQSDLLAIKPGNYQFISFDVLPYLPIKIDAREICQVWLERTGSSKTWYLTYLPKHVVQGISQSAMFRSIWLWRRYDPKVALRFLRTGCSRGAGAALLLGRDQTPWGFEPERNSEPRSWNEPQWLLCQWMFFFFFRGHGCDIFSILYDIIFQ